jgi:hypothetical protein
MNLAATVALRKRVLAYGTSEGVQKEWESRGRGSAYNKVSPDDAEKKKQWMEDVAEEMPVDRSRVFAKRKKIKGAGGQTDSSSFVGRRFTVVDTKYGHVISEHDNPEDAEHAAQARPWSKVLSQPNPAQTPEVRDIARQRLVKTNPDVD